MLDLSLEKASALQTLNLHTSDVTCCDFDENYHLVTGSSDKKVALCEWKTETGFVELPYSPITQSRYGVTKVKFLSQEGELLVSSADGSISIFSADNGELLHVLMHVNLASIRTFCYVRDNKYLLSAADDGTVCVFNLAARTLKKSIQLHDETISVICVSTDSKLIFTGDSTGFVKFWHISSFCDPEVTNGSSPEHCIPDCHDLGINQADFSPKIEITNRGKIYQLVTGGNDNLLKLWKISYRKVNEVVHNCSSDLLYNIVGHGSAVTDVKFHFSGNIIASTSIDKTVRLWLLDTYKVQCIKVLKGHKRYVTTCCFSPDGSLLASGSNDKTVIVWDLTGKRSTNSHLKKVNSLVNINSRAVLSNESPFRKRNSPEILQKLENLGNAVNSCAFSKDDILAAGGTDKLVRLWHQSGNNFSELSVSPLDAHQYAVNQLDFSLCGCYLASCSVDGTTVVWSLTDYNQIGTVHNVEGSIKCCKFSPDSSILATAGDNETVYIWNVPELMLKANMTGHVDAISCLSFTGDSKYLASGCASGSVRIWSVKPCLSTCLLLIENIHDLGLTSSDFSFVNSFSKSSNRYLLATGGNDSLVKLWEVIVVDELTATATQLFQLVGHGGDITCVRFPLNSAHIVASTATDKTARIWDTNFGSCLHILDGKESLPTCCAFSFDTSLLATGTLDKTLIIWDLSKCIKESVAAKPAIESRGAFIEAEESIRRLNGQNDFHSMDVPHEFVCPITQQIMINPVTCSDGHNYEKIAIESWLSSGKLTSPMTNDHLTDLKLVPNTELQSRIMEFVRKSKD
ncbi:hypothetical protein V9T40_000987 [Parthenolecanium corni]|uniref:U-box domain-containing protein n=1 Tax=Parthenolecanium corni TaxID=536013 RepID=A0AAN9TAD2_9HEMI